MLNFGVEGYSTHQSLLRYETWALRSALDHVFYVYFENDLAENQAFHLYLRGSSVPNPFAPLGKLHLSHLALDLAGRLSTSLATRGFNVGRLFGEGLWVIPDRDHTALANSAHHAPDPYTLFRQLLRRFKAAAEGEGASFYLVRLPDVPCGGECRPLSEGGVGSPDRFSVATIVAEEGVETVNLQNCFAEHAPAHPRKSWWRFRREGHWNEAGNRLAAVCLHRFLAGRLGLQPLPCHEVAQVLDRYYAAFETPAPADPAAAAIRARYATLHDDAWTDPLSLPAPWTPSPDKLVVRSHFDVYLHDGWLAYVREDCQPDDLHARFRLHVVPRDLRDLNAQRLPHGFSNFDFNWHSASRHHPNHRFFDDVPSEAGACMMYLKLPDYAIERIRTGQFIQRNGGAYEHLWQGEHVLTAANPRTRPLP